MDTDRNGRVSKAEFMHFMAEEFDRLDVDHSGELDPEELSRSRLRSIRVGTNRSGAHDREFGRRRR